MKLGAAASEGENTTTSREAGVSEQQLCSVMIVVHPLHWHFTSCECQDCTIIDTFLQYVYLLHEVGNPISILQTALIFFFGSMC